MGYPVFQVPAGDVLPVMFTSYDGGTGASITLTGLAVTDIEIYKDGSTTQRASDAGYTLLDTDGIDFDGITGIHGFSIDTGDNTDAGFYTVGAWFTVVVSAVTIDVQTVNFIACQFRLMAAESIAAKPKVDVDGWLGTACATPTVSGVPEVDLTHIGGDAQSGTDLKDFADAGYDPATNKVQGVVLTDTVTTYTGNTVQTGDSFALLGTPVNGTVSADIAAISTQVGNIAAVGAAVNTVAESYTLTTGTQTAGTYASTALLDATPHTHTDTAGTLDLYYQFDIGAQGLPVLVGLTAYSNGASDNYAIQAYNFGASTWETVGTLIGKSGSTYDSYTFTLLTRHVGTGVNLGKTRIRFYSAALTSSTLRVDQIFISYAVSTAFQYTGGYVNDAAATTTSMKTSLTNISTYWADMLLVFTSGALAGLARPIYTFTQTNGVITFDEALPTAPADGVSFIIKAEHIHPVEQIATATRVEMDANSTQLTAILNDTVEIGVAGAGLTNINLPNQTMDIVGNITGNLSGSVGSVTGAVGSVTGAVGSVTGNVGGNVTGSVGSVTARVTANSDQIAGVATSATRLARSTQGIVLGTVGAASTTTSIVTSSLDPAAAAIDQYKGRIITFDQGTTTANLRGQSTDITTNTALGVLTVTALTTAPASGDTFTIT
jgi:hypothetical protein